MHLARALTFITVALSAARHAKADCDSDSEKLAENVTIAAALITYVAECIGELLGGDGDCDVSDLKEACENEGYDFYTYSAKITCDNYYNDGATDVPGCLPKSCTADEEKLLQSFTDDLTSEGYYGCKVELDLEGISAGFSRNVMAGGITTMLAGAGVALL